MIRTLPGFTPVFAYPFGETSDMSDEATGVARQAFGLQVVSAYGGFNRPGLDLLEDARRVGVNGDAQLPWDHVGELAGRQGISEADVVWDLAGKNSRQAA